VQRSSCTRSAQSGNPASEERAMLRSLKDLERYDVSASDGDIGTVVDFLFDDDRWVVRYLVADTDGFFDSRRVLITPISFQQADWGSRRFHVALTREKVKNSPGIDVDRPVSRQHERDYYGYYGYPSYWGYPGAWGLGTYPSLLADPGWNIPGSNQLAEAPADTHLRSASEVRGYHIQGTDDTIGHVEDFIVDDETWHLRYLVVDTSNWWFGKKVLVAPHWADSISWADRLVRLDLSRKAIKDSPEWNPTAGVNRKYEVELFDYYGRPTYWESPAATHTPAPIPRSVRA
jgi:hypothetical protein